MTIDAGDTEKTASVMTVDDDNVELSETFTVTLENPNGAVLGDMSSATGTLTDNDLPLLSVAVADATAGGNVDITVTLSPAIDMDVTVDYEVRIEPGNTAGPNDFDNFSEAKGTVTIPAGEREKTVSVMTAADSDTDEETFTVTLSNPTNAELDPDPDKSSVTGKIVPPLPSLSVADASAEEGMPVVFEVTLSAADDDRDVTVDFKVSFGEGEGMAEAADVTTTEGTVTIDAGKTTGTASVETVDDNLLEGVDPETFTLRLSNPSDNAVLDPDPDKQSATGSITDNELPSLSVSVADAEEGDPANITVTLSRAAAAQVTVEYEVSIEADDTARANDIANFSEAKGTVTIPEGEREKTVSVTTAEDSEIEPDESFTVTLSNPMNAVLHPTDSSAKGMILNDDKPSLSVADASAEEGMPVVFTVTLSEADDDMDVTVDFTVSFSR